MSNMMKMFVGQELESQLKKKYPYMQYPPCMYAKVVGVRDVSGKLECTLRMLDKNRQPDRQFPEVPRVATDIPVAKGETVAVVLLYGECCPYIIGRCV